jgi:hypothetical protein
MFLLVLPACEERTSTEHKLIKTNICLPSIFGSPFSTAPGARLFSMKKNGNDSGQTSRQLMFINVIQYAASRRLAAKTPNVKLFSGSSSREREREMLSMSMLMTHNRTGRNGERRRKKSNVTSPLINEDKLSALARRTLMMMMMMRQANEAQPRAS